MGDAAVSALVKDVLGRLTTLIIQEVGLLWRLKKDVLKLKEDFILIQAVLEDAEVKHTKEKVVELWLRSLKSVSLKVENVLDEVSAEVMIRKLRKELRCNKRGVRAFFSSNHSRLMFRIRMAHKVKTIRRQLNAIAAKSFDLKLTPGPVSEDVGVGGEMPDRETSSLIHSSIIYGRNEEMKKVIEKICNKDLVGKQDADNVPVYAIWGMGGLGKTTLAQLVYNHKRVDEHFELKCWMYVSQNFQVKKLIKGIIESIDKSEYGISQLDVMQAYLQDILRGKRFLIVLDDVWIEEKENMKWDQLNKTLSCGAEGSIVVVTTRSKTTSRMMAKVSEFQQELECLSEEDSWSLFKKLAFAEGREGGDIRELKPIGKKIVEKCKGLPLAVKTLGGLMWSKSSTGDWERVIGSDIWELQDNDILPALKLSYDNLLPHLKQCFAYCCLFPKGYEMEKEILIPMWMSNGLIPCSGDTDWYAGGEQIINCLAWKSFFQPVNKQYKMHDMLHDLAQYVTRHSCLVIGPGKELITSEEVHHLSSSCSEFVFSDQDLEKLRSLRSVFIFNANDYEGCISHIFDFVYLRVLSMAGIRLTTLPESICKLKYLKYLNLSQSNMEELPESIIYLQHLQVLLLEECWMLRKLPRGTRYMRNLQLLNINLCNSLHYLPVGIKDLTRLRTLPRFPIGNNNGAQIGELGDLNLLEGELVITGLHNVGGLEEAKNANLKCKRNLLVLILEWEHDSTEKAKHEMIALDEEVLEGLEPNASLTQLEISKCMGRIISLSWIVNLKNLDTITFYWCRNCEQIPQLGKLPNLRVIMFMGMDSLKCFHDEDNTTSRDNIMFPSLHELHTQRCPNLVSLPNNLPNLKKLRIESCNNLLSLPDEIKSFKDLTELEIEGCENLSRMYEKEIGVDWPKISHILNINIAPIRDFY